MQIEANANMKPNQTPEEVKKEILARFPKEAGKLFYELLGSVTFLHINWKNYRSLFGTSEARTDLLNHFAPLFFGLLEGILRHDIMLAIARLTDHAKYGKYRNASFEYLLNILEPTLTKPLSEKWQSELDRLKDFCEPIRKIRDRLIAHYDLDTVLQYNSDSLPGTSRAYIEEVLEKIREFLGNIEEHFRGKRTAHNYIFSTIDAESLISALEKAQEYEKIKQRKSKQL